MNTPEYRTVTSESTPWPQRFRLGKLALYGAVLQGVGTAATIATGEPVWFGLTTTVMTWKLGNAAHDAHNHYVNGYTNDNPLVKTIGT